MNSNEAKIWFPAKKYGWGWGFPICWQGWAVLLTYIVLLGAGVFFLPNRPETFLVYTLVLSVVLIVICYLRGEKPRWRWGKE